MSAIPTWRDWPHVIETQQFDAENLELMMQHIALVEGDMCQGKSIKRLSKPQYASINFYRDEPSTRTEATFENAAERLGLRFKKTYGQFSSVVKGEDLSDLVMAITQVGGMGNLRLTDFLVIRHKELGAAATAVKAINEANEDDYHRLPLPVINAGDGAGQHPTQALVDLTTIYQERRDKIGDNHPLDDFVLVISGDCRFSRTVNSLCHIIGKFGRRHNIKVIFASHEEVGPKAGILSYFDEHGVSYELEPDFPTALRQADAVYMTRIQVERMSSPEFYEEVKGKFILDASHLDVLPKNAFIMHPLPIKTNGNGPAEIDAKLRRLARTGHPQVAFGRQSLRGVPTRYALLDSILAGLQEIHN